MKQKQFFYSKWYAWCPFIYFAFLAWLQSLNKHFWTTKRFSEPFIIICFAVVLCTLIYTVVRYTIPMLRGKTFLELDSEKIFMRPKNKLVYWTDVEKITFSDFPESIILKLYNQKKVRINVRHVKGDNGFIYNTIFSYHKEAAKRTGDKGDKSTVVIPGDC